MSRDKIRTAGARRAGLMVLCVAALAASALSSRAYTTASFIPIQSAVTNRISALSGISKPTRDQRTELRALTKAMTALGKNSSTDGQELRSLNSALGRLPAFQPQLTAAGSNLLASFDLEYNFVGSLLTELPPSAEATAIAAQYAKLAVVVTKLHAAGTVASMAGLYDASKRKVDAVFFRANQALIIPFPSDLPTDSVTAKINGVNLRTTASSASDNVFVASVTSSNVSITINGLLISGGDGSARGLQFSIPNAQAGTFRYAIPDAASFFNRTAVYTPDETNVAATSGTIFVSTTATEAYGSFSCSGPNFTVTDGRFRVTLTSAP